MSFPLNTTAGSGTIGMSATEPARRSRGLTEMAIEKLARDRMAVAAFCVILFYAGIAFLSFVGLIAHPWDRVVGAPYAPPSLDSLETLFGTDLFGRSVFNKVIQGTEVAMKVGIVTSLIAIPIGVILGALAGYFGGWIDDLIVWFYTTLSSIPSIMLLIAISYVLGKGLSSIYIAIGVTTWVGLARVIRGEFMKHKQREYVIAAESLGATHGSRIFKHILPNVFHFVIINLSIHFISAIKTEVILSYLGLGVQTQPSWGVMIDDAKLELARGVWWQLGGATFAMFFIVLALNIFGDALRDALDPKIK